MSQRLELAPFAVTSGGTIFNVARVTDATDFKTVVCAAAREKRAVFIGAMLTPEETSSP